MAEEGCGLCRYFFQSKDKTTVGVCGRYPPQTIVTDVGGGVNWKETVWPVVSSTNWCGEYRPKSN